MIAGVGSVMWQSIPSEQDMQENYRKSLEESYGEQASSTVHRSMDETHQREERERVRRLLLSSCALVMPRDEAARKSG